MNPRRLSMTVSAIALLAIATLLSRPVRSSEETPRAAEPPPTESANNAGIKEKERYRPLLPIEQVPPERRVWAYLDGERREMDIDEARERGLTVVDLSDDWVPFIFWPQTPGLDDYKPNDYGKTYVDLANDRIDVDGVALRPGEHNYLEVYGVVPSLSVLRRRFISDEGRSCFDRLKNEVFAEYYGPVRVVDAASTRRLYRRYRAVRLEYRKALGEARVRTLEALLERPRWSNIAKRYRRLRWQVRAIHAMQRRLACERMYGKRGPRPRPGEVNWAVRDALKRFERKHHIYGWGMIFQVTAEAMYRSPLENNFESLKRLITERVVDATGILEDGSAPANYTASDGSSQAVRDLVSEFSAVALMQLGLDTPQAAMDFMRAHEEKDFKRLLVALKLPSLPEYYGPHMELQAIVDRGDVWYDLPFDEEAKPTRQPRKKLPNFTLFTTYREQTIPLVHWRTTIGGWKIEKRADQEYYKYKVSDIGPRVWKNIVAGPVWVPPKNTPSPELVKRRRTGRIVAQSTFGPGYASAYGLVAAYHIDKTGYDNQIRTHGTVNYMSVQKGFSHGCHRLRNYAAVRLFSFVLRHRNFLRKGQTRLAYHHRFEHRGEEYQINLRTRGYYYELTPPIDVEVLEGNIKGELKEPIADYIKRPSQIYQEDLPQHQKKDPAASGAPRTGEGKSNPMQQPQTL